MILMSGPGFLPKKNVWPGLWAIISSAFLFLFVTPSLFVVAAPCQKEHLHQTVKVKGRVRDSLKIYFGTFRRNLNGHTHLLAKFNFCFEDFIFILAANTMMSS